MPDNDTAEVKRRLGDQAWRLNNLYTIETKGGQVIPFRMNWAQEDLYESLWHRNLILKARQLGMSTFIGVLQLDTALFNKNTHCGTIAHDRESVEELFQRNIKGVYDRLPEWLRQAVPEESSSAKKLSFPNGSSIRVATSLRSGVVQLLHVSEFGKICAKSPDKAKEVVTGSFETVGQEGLIFIESTAEGREGYFYDYATQAQNSQDAQKELTTLDWRFFFYPWWQHPDYVMSPRGVVITQDRHKYFNEIEAKLGRKLSPERRAWYVKKAEVLGEDMLREYPSLPEESFQETLAGAYYGDQMKQARKDGRITRVPVDPGLAVDTWWDLGMDDSTTIWFIQRHGMEYRAVDYYENNGEGLAHYAKVLQDKGYSYGEHVAPHDIAVRELGSGQSRIDRARELGIRFSQSPRLPVVDGIEEVRNIIPLCWFDEEACDEGIRSLEAYRKEWDERLGRYRAKPLHNWASHGADAFRTGAQHRGNSRAKAVSRPVKRVNATGWT